MSGAFSTKRPRTSGSQIGVSGKSGVVGKYASSARTTRWRGTTRSTTAQQHGSRRAKPNGPSALHTLETCVHYFSPFTPRHHKKSGPDAGCFDAPCRPRGTRSERGPRVGAVESAAAARGRSRVSGLDSKDRPRSLVGAPIRRLGPAHRGGAHLRSLP